MADIKPRTFKGTRDLLPEDMRIRESILTIMKSVFTRYGFAPLETPAVEFLDILAGKYGEDADKLLYPLAYKGGRELALRYDLTVPLARVIALNPHLPKPFKRFQIQPVWRADNPQLTRGRYREFYQCDVDTVGSSEPMTDAEIIALTVDVIRELMLGTYQIRINSRKILNGMITGTGFDGSAEQDVCRSIDKLDKDGLAAVHRELTGKGYRQDCVANLCTLLEKRVLDDEGLEIVRSFFPRKPSPDPGSTMLDDGLNEIRTILTILGEMGIPRENTVFDFALARGLDYYTGPIFEAVLPGRPEVGSIAGGGRYDDMIGIFMKESVPAVGISFGLERIHAIFRERSDSTAAQQPDVDFLVCFFDTELRAECLQILRMLHGAELRAEIYPKPDKIKKQFGYADRKNIPFVIILGPDEKAAGSVTVKDMTAGRQKSVETRRLIETAKNLALSAELARRGRNSTPKRDNT